ncbi:MAG: glycosyltransferase family 39 protein [Cyanobacteria bacterium J06638_22]
MDAGTRTIPDSTFRFRAQPPPPTWHYLLLLGLVLLGLGLRFWQLDSKPLWLDEVITAVFALGRNYREISTNTFIGLETLTEQFALYPTTTCATIAQTLITDSSHPPLFFCGLHRWLVWLNPAPEQLAWALRSLPALLGTLLIPLIYALNRVAVSSAAGLVGAGFMAVSPFAVYLSQEARHYTLPMVLITLSLLCGVWMLQDLMRDRVRAWAWLLWIAVNLCGLYTHYFFLMALVAQMVALVGVCLRQGQGLLNWRGLLLGLAIAIFILGYFPWIPVLYQHFSQPATDWLNLAPGWGRLNPLYQGLAGWIIFFILLPVENQPLAIAIPLGLIMLAVFVGLAWQVWQGLRSFYNQHPTHPAVSFLLLSTLLIGLEFLVIIYGLGKDLTLAPRYNFVYFPGVCALVGIALAQRVQRRSRFPSSLSRRSLTSRNWRQLTTILVLALGLLSSMFVVYGLGFQKSYNPAIVADNVLRSPHEAMAIAFIYPTVQELALHLSFAYAIQQELVGRDAPSNVALAFLPQGATQTPAEVLLPELEGVPETLWIITSPGYDTFSDTRNLSTSIGETVTCQIEPEGRYQIFGVPYQRYTCQRS